MKYIGLLRYLVGVSLFIFPINQTLMTQAQAEDYFLPKTERQQAMGQMTTVSFSKVQLGPCPVSWIITTTESEII